MKKISEMIKLVIPLFVAFFLFFSVPSSFAISEIDDILTQRKPLTIDDLERIYQYKLDRGAANITVVSCYLIRASKRLLEDGNAEAAKMYAEYAVKISPEYPSAYTNRAMVEWAHNRLKINKLLKGLYGYVYATLTNYTYAAISCTKILFTVFYSLLLTVVVFSLTSLYKYSKLLQHDLSHFLPSLLPKHFHIFVTGLILCLPFLLKWSIFLAAFYWLLLLFLYHKRKEQQLIIIFAWLLAFSPFIVQSLSQLIVTNASERFHYIQQANKDNWEDETALMLGKRVGEHPYDLDSLFSLALLKKRDGFIEEARHLYATLVELDPHNSRLWCNLGNTYLAENNINAAISHYERAVALCPNSVEGFYNLSRAQLLQYMFTDSNRSFRKAKQLDSDRVDKYLKIFSDNINRKVIDQTLSDADFWKKSFMAADGKNLLSEHLWEYIFGGIAYRYRYLVFVVILLFVVLVFTDRHNSRSVACEYCGCAVCKKCKQLATEFQLCRRCAAVFKNDNDIIISVTRKAEQVASIERHQGRRIFVGKLISLLIPGSGHLLCGRPFRGAAIVFLFCFLLCKLLIWDELAVNPWQMIHGTATFDLLAIVIPLALLYSYSLGHFNFSSTKLYQFVSLIRVTRKELQVKQ